MDIVTYDGDATARTTCRPRSACSTAPATAGRTWCSARRTTRRPGRSQARFAAPLNKGLIPQATLDGWATGANTPCTVNGTIYCLRNDLAQTVLWYNAKLMQQWGYQVPTTWEEYQALGEKVAAEHPGYLVGAAGDTFAPEIYLWAGKCGANQITGPKAVTVNTTSAACTRMATLLDTIIANKTHVDQQRLLLGLRQERARQDPDDARPVVVRRLPVPGHVQDAQGTDRGRADAALGRRHGAGGRQRRRRHLAALGAFGPSQGGHRLPDLGHHVGRLPGQGRRGLSGLHGGGQDLAGQPGQLRLLRQRHHRAAAGRGRKGLAGLGVRPVQPGVDLGRDHHARPDRGQDHRVDVAGVADARSTNYARADGYEVTE